MPTSSVASQDDDWKSTGSEERALLPPARTHLRWRPTNSRPSLLYTSIAVVALVLTNILTFRTTARRVEAAHSLDISASEIFRGLDRSLSWRTFSNHRLNVTSRWSATPSVDVDHAWEELGVKDQLFLLPAKVGRMHGLDPLKHLYVPEGTVGQGLEGFGVFVQGLHDLHCLNQLRKALYFNKEYYRRFENDTLTPEWARQSHARHCLDNIRERLMCTADAGIIPAVWLSEEENYPLFGTRHKCHSYDAMMEWFTDWQKANGRGSDWTVHLSAPPGAIFTVL